MGIFHIAPHLGGQKPQNSQFWGVKRRFQAKTREIQKRAYYQNYCIDSNQILHSDKDHQMPFVGGPPQTHYKSKMADGRHLGKSKSCYISAAFLPILTKFGMVKHFEPPDRTDR